MNAPQPTAMLKNLILDESPGPSVISTEFLDDLVHFVLEKDMLDELEIPVKLANRLPYTHRLVEHFNQADLDYMLKHMEQYHLDVAELTVLNNLTNWCFRNSGSVVRSALGLIGVTVIQMLRSIPDQNTSIKANSTSSLLGRFLDESPSVIYRTIHTAAAHGAMEAKLPLRNMSEEIAHISTINEDCVPAVKQLEKARLLKIINFKQSSATVSNDQEVDRYDYVVKALVELVQAASTYKREDDFVKLRSFMTNAQHVAGMVRIFTHDQALKRLAGDVLDQAHSTDRLLASNCVAAAALLERLNRGELVYKEVLDLAKHQHRIMAVEVQSTITVFSYFLSKAKDEISAKNDLHRMVSNLIRHCGVANAYMDAIHIAG